MAQITFTVNEETLKKIDDRAKVEVKSRSKFCSDVIDQYISQDPAHDSNVSTLHATIEALQKEKEIMLQTLRDKDALLHAQDALITQLKDDVSWARGEISKMTDRMVQLQLPPGGGFWSRMFGRERK